MATATHTDMDTGTAMAIRMGGTTTAITAALTTAMATRLEGTRAAITAARATKMAIPPIQEWRSCNADLREPGITHLPTAPDCSVTGHPVAAISDIWLDDPRRRRSI